MRNKILLDKKIALCHCFDWIRRICDLGRLEISKLAYVDINQSHIYRDKNHRGAFNAASRPNISVILEPRIPLIDVSRLYKVNRSQECSVGNAVISTL